VDRSALADHPALAPAFLARVLGQLVRTPSANPGEFEAAMARTVADLLAPTGAAIELVETFPGRPSVGARLSGRPGGPRVVLNGHMDTVPVGDPDAWSVDPLGAEIRDGRLYGRGACDMKAGLATQIAVAHALADRMSEASGELVLHFAVGEERAEPGTLSLLQAGFGGDVGVCTEPTELRLATVQRGAAFLSITISGRAAHAGRAELGRNPLDRLGAILQAIRAEDADARARPHPLLDGGTCTATMVDAGTKENVVPERCTVVVDRRLLPGETPESALATLDARVREALGAADGLSVETEVVGYAFAPAEVAADDDVVTALQAAATSVTGRALPLWGTPYSSDVRNLVNDAGIRAVTFGPGSIDLAHAPDESVPLDEVHTAAQVLAAFAAQQLLPACPGGSRGCARPWRPGTATCARRAAAASPRSA
jgi:succinyl-diaminopimelate desuccinylase